jgi:hypothetical protein
LEGSTGMNNNNNNNNNASKQGKNKKKGDYMKMGTVVEIRKNGAVAAIKDSSEDKYFVPGWSYLHVNTLKTEFLTTTQVKVPINFQFSVFSGIKAMSSNAISIGGWVAKLLFI